MIRKLAALAGAGALLLGAAVPAFATFPFWPSNDVSIVNLADVTTKVYTKADSGDNEIGGKYVWGSPKITSGAAGAGAQVSNVVNYSEIGCPGCNGDVSLMNWADVFNKVETKADSGDNEIGGKCVGGGTITSGAASAASIVDNIVNFTSVGVDLD